MTPDFDCRHPTTPCSNWFPVALMLNYSVQVLIRSKLHRHLTFIVRRLIPPHSVWAAAAPRGSFSPSVARISIQNRYYLDSASISSMSKRKAEDSAASAPKRVKTVRQQPIFYWSIFHSFTGLFSIHQSLRQDSFLSISSDLLIGRQCRRRHRRA